MTLYYSLPLFCLRHTYHLAVMDRLIQPFLVCPSSSYRPQEVKHCGYIPAKQNCLFVCARLIHCLYFLLHHYCVWVFFFMNVTPPSALSFDRWCGGSQLQTNGSKHKERIRLPSHLSISRNHRKPAHLLELSRQLWDFHMTKTMINSLIINNV